MESGQYLKCLGAIAGCCAGFFVGFAISYYAGDHGDVESAFISVLTMPLGIIAGAFAGWFGVRWLERR